MASIPPQALNSSAIALNSPSTHDPAASSHPPVSSPVAFNNQHDLVSSPPTQHATNYHTQPIVAPTVQYHCTNAGDSAPSSFHILFAKTFVGNVIGTVGLLLALGLGLFSAVTTYRDVEWSEHADAVQACASLYVGGTPACKSHGS